MENTHNGEKRKKAAWPYLGKYWLDIKKIGLD